MDVHGVVAWGQAGDRVPAGFIRRYTLDKVTARYDDRGSGNGSAGRICHHTVECPSLDRSVGARRGLSKKRRHECGSKEDDRSIVHMLEGRRRKTHGYEKLCKVSLNKTGARFNNSLHQGPRLRSPESFLTASRLI